MEWVGPISVLRVGLNPICVWFKGWSHFIFYLVRGIEWDGMDNFFNTISCWLSWDPAVIVGPCCQTLLCVLAPTTGVVRLDEVALHRIAMDRAHATPSLGPKLARVALPHSTPPYAMARGWNSPHEATPPCLGGRGRLAQPRVRAGGRPALHHPIPCPRLAPHVPPHTMAGP